MTFLHKKQEFKPQELSDYIAPDCHGLNFYEIDTGLQDLLHCYMPDDLRQHLEPHYRKLGELSGNQLDDW